MLIATIALSVFFAVRLPHLEFNYEFEAFFPNENHELEHYQAYREKFEYDNEFILIGIENRDGIFRKNFLLKVDSLCNILKKVEDVKSVTSPTNLKILEGGGMFPVQMQLLHPEDTGAYKADSIRAYRTPYLVGSYFAEDGKSISLFIKTSDILSKKRSDRLADAVRKAVDRCGFDDVHIVGRIFAQQVYLTNIQREFIWFLSISFILVLLFLWITFRRPYGVIVPVAIVLTAILWTLGIMQLLGKPVDIMIIMLPTMVFVAGMSDVVHFFSKYFEEMARGRPQEKIYPLILKEVGFPTFLTLVTTVVGFLSLLFSSIGPVRDFGIYTSLGVTLAFILTYTLLPAIIYFYKPAGIIRRHEASGGNSAWMSSLFLWIIRRPVMLLSATVLVLLVTAFGISKIRINNILLEDLNDRVRIKQDFRFFDEHYSGVRPFELHLTLSDSRAHFLDETVMRDVNKLEQFVRREYGAGFVISPAAIVRNIWLARTGEEDQWKFPPEEEYEETVKLLRDNKKNKDIRKVISSDGREARISAKTRDIGSMAMREHNGNLLKFMKDSLPQTALRIDITGAAHLLDRNNEYMVDNMTQGFAFSIAVIGLLTFLLHRSWRMVLVFILPNLIPLAIIAGIMGFAGIELKAATSLVFSIAFGIATDDTIHFISRLKIELSYGKSLLYALKRTYLETGKPIVLTTFILMGGFVSLMTSNFESTFYFGFLICITMFIAVAADLLLLPVLLLLIYGRRKK